ncbi:S-adenosyl-L-methionine-dependent methyltransferase [Lanmaoa asiatica]|nr:S-adenosyl-L-methionine-dependent methyltransferase [Lanmaoa asiatica]
MSQTHIVHDRETLHAHAHHHHDSHMHTPHSHQSPDALVDAYEAANKDYFDTTAHIYNYHPNILRLAEKIGEAMLDTELFEQGITTVMDFACGTGHISRKLAEVDPKSIVGVDISQGMVDEYNRIISDHDIPPEEMRAICIAPNDWKLEGITFDVIVCASSYHHFASIEEVTETLVTAYLKPGGSLLVADLVYGESTPETFPEDLHHIVAHKGGFTEEEIRSTFEKAGLKNITFEIILQAKYNGHPVDVFLARGDK